jgi:hypothetical protein
MVRSSAVRCPGGRRGAIGPPLAAEVLTAEGSFRRVTGRRNLPDRRRPINAKECPWC